VRFIAIFLLTLCGAASAGAFVPPQQAFGVSLLELAPGEYMLRANVLPGYALYRDKFKIAAGGATTVRYSLPRGHEKHDPFFGKTILLTGSNDVPVRVESAKPGEVSVLDVQYIGCKIDEFCYPPQTLQFQVQAQ